MTGGRRGRTLLLAQRTFGIPPLGDPPADMTDEERSAWNDILAAAPSPTLFRYTDGPAVFMAAVVLARWRAGDRDLLREAYRCLGRCLVDMRARRRLMFPDRPPRRHAGCR